MVTQTLEHKANDNAEIIERKRFIDLSGFYAPSGVNYTFRDAPHRTPSFESSNLTNAIQASTNHKTEQVLFLSFLSSSNLSDIRISLFIPPRGSSDQWVESQRDVLLNTTAVLLARHFRGQRQVIVDSACCWVLILHRALMLNYQPESILGPPNNSLYQTCRLPRHSW